MGENIIFPYDYDTVNFIKEMEVYLGVFHENIMMMKTWQLHEYINKLTLLMIHEHNLDGKSRKIYGSIIANEL